MWQGGLNVTLKPFLNVQGGGPLHNVEDFFDAMGSGCPLLVTLEPFFLEVATKFPLPHHVQNLLARGKSLCQKLVY